MAVVDVDTFRASLPEFGDADAYPDAQIQLQLDLATDSLNPYVWGVRLRYGIIFYAAHYLALAAAEAQKAKAGAASGAVPGSIQGLTTSRSVGSVSKSVDVSTGSVDGAGMFNTTTYGRQYATLLGSVGIGVLQL